MSMKVIDVPIEKVRPFEDNPRFNDVAVNDLKKSISEFRFRQPIVVDADYVIVIGHTRYKAAVALGRKTVPVVVASDLTKEKATALRIADNRLADLSEWNAEVLKEELEALDGTGLLEYTGFDNDEIQGIVKSFEGDGGGGEKDGARQYFYELKFATVEQQERFFDVLVRLREWYPDIETIGQRLAAFVDDF